MDDGNGGTASREVVITVTGTNDAPQIDLNSTVGEGDTGFSAVFTENGAAVSIADGNIDVDDVDTQYLRSATITLTNKQDGDKLDFSEVDSELFTVAESGDGKVLTITAKNLLMMVGPIVILPSPPLLLMRLTINRRWKM